MTSLLALHVGRIEPLGLEGPPSGIDKRPVQGPVCLTPMGLESDAQADRRHHGGADKALHHYPQEHYHAWREELPRQAGLLHAGGFGENLSTVGLTEATVCVGDVFRLGGAVIQVSQGRSPCAKLNIRFGVEDMARRVLESSRTGWYYRVLEAGEIAAGDEFSLLERPCPAWNLARVWQVLYGEARDTEALTVLSALPQLTPGWREKAASRVGAGKARSSRLFPRAIL